MSLREATKEILDSDNPAELLRLADMYIESFNKMPEAFVLPAKHVILRPVIEAFSDDLDAFVRYIHAVREQFPPGLKRADLQMFYRTILTRSVQQSRRQRLSRAVAVMEQVVGRRLEREERERVAKRLEQNWASRRMDFLKSHRGATDKGRLRSDERSELLEEFWGQIDAEIAQRDLPMLRF